MCSNFLDTHLISGLGIVRDVMMVVRTEPFVLHLDDLVTITI